MPVAGKTKRKSAQDPTRAFFDGLAAPEDACERGTARLA